MKSLFRDTNLFKVAFFVGSYFFAAGLAKATHIRAGEVTVERTDEITRTFTITFTGFRDTGSSVQFGSGYFDFGDGSTESGPFAQTKSEVGNDTEMVTFSVTHTYEGNSTYIISYQEDYRNANIINMDNSVNTTFYVETMIVIDPYYGIDNSPLMTVPPIDEAAVGTTFIHNAGAYDPDGDSIAYAFTVPEQGSDYEVANYRVMNDAEFYTNYSQGNQAQTGVPTLTLDPEDGDLVWDAPGDVLNQGTFAEYNVAYKIEEYRYMTATESWDLIGYVVRDMQIIVEDSDNQQPQLEIPDDICVVAGTDISEIITGTDPDGDEVMLEAYGGPFEVTSAATYSPDPAVYQASPATLEFDWSTVCAHVRERAYQAVFKVTDNPDTGPSLTNFATLNITIVGPAPTGLTAINETGRTMQLNWDDYSCSNASTMEIWRRVGSYDIDVDDCDVGMPSGTGYVKIDEVDISTTEYLDDNDGDGLPAGARYCYRLVAAFADPEGGESYVSEEACDSIISNVPIITNVDILSTDETSGKIQVTWTPPYQIDSALYPPSYIYDVFRGEGYSSSGTYVQVASKISDTTYTDSGLNTYGTVYNYYIRFYDGTGEVVDSSSEASSVRLTLTALTKSMELTWQATVPWSNMIQTYPYHYIYRDHILDSDTTQLVLIDSVDVTQEGYYYMDEGDYLGETLDTETEYCYFVTTQGSYDNDAVLPAPLLNRSQVACAQPNDSIPPCSPLSLSFDSDNQLSCEEAVADNECGTNVYSHTLTWEADESGDEDCDDDVSYYNIYFSETGLDEDYELIGTTTSTSYTHSNLSSYKGCYKISAVDKSGNESDVTEAICADNCPVYKFPNVFTPNGDGVNDVFGPMNNQGLNISGFDNSNCPRFVESVVFKVVNRTGTEVFTYDSSKDTNGNGIYIEWDGKNKAGKELPAGVYYYIAEVEYDVLATSKSHKTLKGWVQLVK